MGNRIGGPSGRLPFAVLVAGLALGGVAHADGTVLLFPWVTNRHDGVLYDTQISVANVEDPLGAAPKSGTVTFYLGGDAGTTAVSPTIAPGGRYSFALSQVQPQAFEGYVIAVADFTARGLTVTTSPSPASGTVSRGYSTATILGAWPPAAPLPHATHLLFPYLASSGGADAWITIANTTRDPRDPFGTIRQSGTVTLSYYGTVNGVAVPPLTRTSGTLFAGDELAFVLGGDPACDNPGSSAFGLCVAGFQGYVIAVANFGRAVGQSSLSLSSSQFGSTPAIDLGIPRGDLAPHDLLFSYATNQAGQDTAIAISNTALDPFGTNLAGGKVKLFYFSDPHGVGPSYPPQSTVDALNPGDLVTFTLGGGGSHGIAATPGFQGYILAVPEFLGAAGTSIVFSYSGFWGAATAARPVGHPLALPAPVDLLFPFATTQNGLDSGLFLANTSQSSGSCALSFDPDGGASYETYPLPGGGQIIVDLGATHPGFGGSVLVTCDVPAIAYGLQFGPNQRYLVPMEPEIVSVPAESPGLRATAGADQTVCGGAKVGLDGSQSGNPYDALLYSWSEASGAVPPATGPRPSFIAPNPASGPEVLQFVLTITDRASQQTDTSGVNVTVEHTRVEPPVAAISDATRNLTVEPNATVVLDGSASHDPEGDPAHNQLAYSWRQLAGPAVQLSDPASATPSFVAPASHSTLIFGLRVHETAHGADCNGAAPSREEIVTVFVGAHTILLVPYVVAVAGFDTTIRITNVSDTLGDAQDGTVTLLYDGSTRAGYVQTTASVAAGEQLVFSAAAGGDGIDPAPGAFGYLVAIASFEARASFIDSFAGRSAEGAPAQILGALPRAAGATTQLLFPVVTNQDGLDTGLAIANTSLDPLGTQPQNGTATLYFFASDGSPAYDPVPLGVIPAGGLATAVTSQIAPGFSGYAIAVCDFRLASGYAYESSLGGLAQAGNSVAVDLGDPRTEAGASRLLFPIATNGPGRDTRLTISNTSTDPAGAFTVTLHYHGNEGDVRPDQTSTPVAPGDQLQLTLGGGGDHGVGSTPGFEGYIIADMSGPGAFGQSALLDDAGGAWWSATLPAQPLPAPSPSTSSWTDLLFPFVRAGAGWDTRVVIDNTSDVDGACSVELDPDGRGPVPRASPTIRAHGHWELALSDEAPGFQGYLLVACSFPGAAGVALESDVGAVNAMVLYPAEAVAVPASGAGVTASASSSSVCAGAPISLHAAWAGSPYDSVAFSWTEASGAAQPDPVADPTVTAPQPGPDGLHLSFQVTATELASQDDRATASVAVDVKAPNRPPVALAEGPDRPVNEGTPVELSATASHDPDGDPITYRWTQVAGATVSGLDLSAPVLDFDAPTDAGPDPAVPDTRTFALLVSDTGACGGPLASPVAAVLDVVIYHRPVAAVAPVQPVCPGTTVKLDGTGSTDPNGLDLSYAWSQPGGPSVVLAGATTATPTFTAPPGPTTVALELGVADRALASAATDAVDVVILPLDRAPTAAAGADQVVAPGATVTLDGGASVDPDGDPLAYSWTQIGGPAVQLSSAKAARPTFTAPVLASEGADDDDDGDDDCDGSGRGRHGHGHGGSCGGGPVVLTFQLTVSDGAAGSLRCGGPLTSPADTVVVTVQRAPAGPHADAGTLKTVKQGARVELDGSRSADPDGDPLTYAWIQLPGPHPVTLHGATSPRPWFIAPKVQPGPPAPLSFQLTVTDPGGLSSSATVTIKVLDAPRD